MSVDRIILESAGVLVVGGGAFLLSNVFALAPLAQNLSKSQSTIYFVAIPVAVYAAFRLYFGLLFYATKSLSVSRPRIGVYALFKAVPNSEEALRQLYAEVVGDLADVVWKAGEGQVRNAQKLGGRIFGLLCGWFLLLFSFELLVRLILFVLSLAVGAASGGKKTQVSEDPATAAEPEPEAEEVNDEE